MKKAKHPLQDDMRSEYSREDLGKLTRGKYVKRLAKGSNLVLIEPAIAKAFPSSAAVNRALGELLAVARRNATPARRSTGSSKASR